MKIAILSGKGGTGKTTVSTNLAKYLSYSYVDTDVEEPNGHIFLKPSIEVKDEVLVEVPLINPERCQFCGACARACQFNAIAVTLNQVMVFNELCHGCKACSIVCPHDAITFKNRPIGTYSKGSFEGKNYYGGLLNIKEPMAGPIISHLKKITKDESNLIIDCSPGASCNVVKALDDVDYAILVTEPTKFGLHDLKVARDMVKEMGVPHGVLINRGSEDDYLIEDYLKDENIQHLATIPFSREIAVRYSKGDSLTEVDVVTDAFKELEKKVLRGDS